MPLDHSYVGRDYPVPEPYLVSREKIREFAEAIGATDAAYVDRDAARALGYPDVIAPPTFAITVIGLGAQLMISDESLGLNFGRVVHGDQRFEYARPIAAGDQLTCVVYIDEITSRGGHDFLTYRGEVRTTAGEPLVTGRTRLVIRGVQ